MTINCKGKLIDLAQSKVMGVINVTPDSFFDGGNYNTSKSILKQAEKLINEGAAFIDIGGYSSRPGAENISVDEELKRVIPAIELIINQFPEALISVDTFRAKVAQKAVEAGACIINDISGGNLDASMFQTIADLQTPYVLMHMAGTPQNMQNNPHYTDVILEINQYFSKKVNQLRALGVNDIILDAGFGFGKTLTHNYTLLHHYELIGDPFLPTLIGISRKSMIYKTFHITAKEALNGTSVLHTIALQKGAKILRAHDVKEAVECIRLVEISGGLN